MSPAACPRLRFRAVSVMARGGGEGPAWVSGRCLRVLCPPLPFYLDPSTLRCRNAEKILGYLHTNVLSRDLIPPHVNFSHLTAKDYTDMYRVIKAVKEDRFSALGLDPCLLEDELDKVWDRLPFPGLSSKADVGVWAPEPGCGRLGPARWPQKAARDSLAGSGARTYYVSGEGLRKGIGQSPALDGDGADTHHRNHRSCTE